MSNNTILITRSVNRDDSVKLELSIEDDTLTTKYQLEKEICHLENDHLWYEFAEHRDIRHMRKQILEAVYKMQGSSFYTLMCRLVCYITKREMVQTEVIPFTKRKLKPHFMCGESFRKKKEIFQSVLKHKLAALDKDSKVLKQFEDHKCSICLSSYKEILDEDLHIVVSNCGHPLCCKCAEYIIESEKECPQCRGEIDEFNLMKFKANLKIKTENQKLFL